MSEIYDQNAYNEGVKRADELATAIREMVAKAPQGFRVEVTGQQMQIHAPHGVVANPGRWNLIRDTTYTNNIETLKEQEFNDVIQVLQKKAAEIDNAAGFTEQMQKIFPTQSAEKKQDIKEPEPTAAEKRLKDIEQWIAESHEAIAIAMRLGLQEQVKVANDSIKELEIEKTTIQKGYERIWWDRSKYEARKLEEYQEEIPLDVLKELEKAKTELPAPECFKIWVESSDPILVAYYCNKELFIRIAEW